MSGGDLARELARLGFRGTLEPEAALAPHTTWRIGGPAELLAAPADAPDAILAVRFAVERGLEWRVLGNGSNLLVADAGVRGLVLHVRKTLDAVTIDPPRIVAGGGALFPLVANRAARAGLAGIEFGAGIPGTLGGAIVMNAGWHEHEIGSRVEWVRWLDEQGTNSRLDRDACAFRYRGSRFRGRRGLVLEAGLALGPGEPDAIQERLDFYVASRRANQPTELPSCGSVFLKPPGDFAGRLIDQAGLKGLRAGAIEVSPKHANFFVNTGGGTAADVLALVERVEREVRERFGITLEREFEYWR